MMTVPFADLKKQYQLLKKEIDAAIQSVINETAFIGGNNSYVKKFEEAFADFNKVKHCMSCANGTDSLEILLKATGIGSGDEVIVPAHSWISTSEAVSNVGAVPVFVDTLPKYHTIDTAKIAAKISTKTKAIIPVHIYGLPAEMDEIMALSVTHNLFVLEDCAQAHGALYKGKKVGTIGHAASFSFYPGKNLGAYGDAGGMITNDDALAATCRMIANHGQLKKHDHQMEGRNSRLDGIQAAVLSVKLPHLNNWNALRQEHTKTYKKAFSNTDIYTPDAPDYSDHVSHLYVIEVANRDVVQDFLKQSGIETAIHYPTPLPLLPAYAYMGLKESDFPVSSLASTRILSLPMFPEMTAEMIQYVVEKVQESVSVHS